MAHESIESKILDRKFENFLKDSWAIRSCSVYQDEYDDCTSLKARFHQYFISGEKADCSQWLTDYKNCIKYEKSDGNDFETGVAIIKSEEARRKRRLAAHFANDTWQKRKQPPENWDKPLPEWFEKRNENTYLEMKQVQLEGRTVPEEINKPLCLIM